MFLRIAIIAALLTSLFGLGGCASAVTSKWVSSGDSSRAALIRKIKRQSRQKALKEGHLVPEQMDRVVAILGSMGTPCNEVTTAQAIPGYFNGRDGWFWIYCDGRQVPYQVYGTGFDLPEEQLRIMTVNPPRL